jgi:hypothetical protein
MQFQYAPSDVDAFLRQYYGNQRLLTEPQIYTSNLGTIASPGQAAGTIQISMQADFFMFGIATQPNNATAGVFSGQMQLMLTDAGSARPFFNSPLSVGNVAPGNAQWSMPFPRFLGRNTAVTISAVNPAGYVEVTDFTVSLVGVSVRTYG